MSERQIDFEISFFSRLVKSHPDFVDALKPLAELYTHQGLFEKGLEIDRQLAKLCPEDHTVFYNLACSLALTGHKDEALGALERAVKLGFDDFKHLKKDPDLKPLRRDPRFKALFPEV